MLAKRGLDLETLHQFGVTSHEEHGGDWIAMPTRRQGQVVREKYRTIAGEKKFYAKAGGIRTWYNEDVLTDPAFAGDPVYIFEGEPDCWTAVQCGFARSVSVPDGALDKAEERPGDHDVAFQFIDDTWAALNAVPHFIIATDGDGPGQILRDELARRLGKDRCKWVEYPRSADGLRRLKDLNEVHQAWGHDGVHATLGRARWMPVPGLFRLGDMPPLETKRRYNIGIPVLDRHYNIRLGDLALLLGIPSMGKSTLLNDIACRMAETYDWTTCFASLEQDPRTDHRRALRRWYNRKPVSEQTLEEKGWADEWIDRHFAFVVASDEEEASLDWVLEKAAASALRHGAKLVVIDPWNELDLIRPKDMSQTEYIGLALKSIKRFSRRMDVHTILAAHPTKQRKNEDGTYAIPGLYESADSAHFYNKPDVGLIIHREDVTRPETLLRVGKSRYHDEIGRPGDVPLRFNDYTGRYEVTEGA